MKKIEITYSVAQQLISDIEKMDKGTPLALVLVQLKQKLHQQINTIVNSLQDTIKEYVEVDKEGQFIVKKDSPTPPTVFSYFSKKQKEYEDKVEKILSRVVEVEVEGVSLRDTYLLPSGERATLSESIHLYFSMTEIEFLVSIGILSIA